MAERALGGYVQKAVGEATHYHTIWVVPYWQATVLKVAQIGAHIFYRWNGELGRPTAFTGPYAGSEPETPMPAGLTAQDIAAMAAPTAALAAIASDAPANAPPETEAKPAVRIVEAASAPSLAPAIAPDVVPAPVSYFGGAENARPQRLPTAGR